MSHQAPATHASGRGVEGAPAPRRTRGHRGRRGALVPAAAARAGDGVERQCAVCRAKRPRLMLFEVSRQGPATRRRSYVCITRACLEGVASTVAASQPLHALAKMRISAAVGLARRAGALRLGASALAGTAPMPGTLLLGASDMAERTARALGEELLVGPHTAGELGRAAGARRPLAAVQIAPGRHAQQAAYWQQVWYETRPREGQGQIEVGQ